MADYRNDDDRTLPGGTQGMNRTPERDPEHLLPEHTHAAAPGTIGAVSASDPDAVRDEIQRTRERMSETIGAIEGALQRKKDEVRERLDFVAPVREKPWVYAAGVFGGALALGWLTGGHDREDEHVKVPRALLEGLGLEHAGESGGNGHGGEWESRSRELMQVVARQEEEIRQLRGGGDQEDFAFGGMGTERWQARRRRSKEWNEHWNYDDAGDDFDDFSALEEEQEGGIHIGAPLAGAIAAGVAGIVGGLATRLLRRRGGMDVEVELEQPHGAARDVHVDEGFRAARRDALGEAEPPLGGFGRASSAAGQREMDVEVELERESRGLRLPNLSPLAAAVAGVSAAVVGGMAAKLFHRGQREEMEVEVDLDGGRGATGTMERPIAPYAAPAQRPASTSVEGQAPAAASGEREYQVELEGDRPGARGYSEEDGGVGLGNPPLM